MSSKSLVERDEIIDTCARVAIEAAVAAKRRAALLENAPTESYAQRAKVEEAESIAAAILALKEGREYEHATDSIQASDYDTIDALPFSDRQKRIALVWMANMLWNRLAVGKLGHDGHGKSYDPLSFSEDGTQVHSYVFNLHDGGRHHSFTSFADIEKRVIAETAEALIASPDVKLDRAKAAPPHQQE